MPATIVGDYGFPWIHFSEGWKAVGNRLSVAFDLFPMSLAWWFPTGAPKAPLLLGLVLLTAGIDWLITKRVPRSIPLWAFVAGVVGWFLLSALTVFAWVYIATK